jgi:hypothetical protein
MDHAVLEMLDQLQDDGRCPEVKQSMQKLADELSHRAR